MSTDRPRAPWSAFLELPLAAASFVTYRVTRAIFKVLARAQFALRPALATNWRVISEPALARPLVLPLVMTTGPRWNTHAVIGTVGPLRVESTLSFDRAVASRAAGSWTAVINRYPHFGTVARIGGGDGVAHGPSELKLEPGRYNIIFRYYLLRGAPTYPALSVDGRPVVPEASFPEGINEFYKTFGAARREFKLRGEVDRARGRGLRRRGRGAKRGKERAGHAARTVSARTFGRTAGAGVRCGQDGARAREELLELGGGVDTVVVTAVVAVGEEGGHRSKGRRYWRSADGESNVVEDLFGDPRIFDGGEKRSDPHHDRRQHVAPSALRCGRRNLPVQDRPTAALKRILLTLDYGGGSVPADAVFDGGCVV